MWHIFDRRESWTCPSPLRALGKSESVTKAKYFKSTCKKAMPNNHGRGVGDENLTFVTIDYRHYRPFPFHSPSNKPCRSVVGRPVGRADQRSKTAKQARDFTFSFFYLNCMRWIKLQIVFASLSLPLPHQGFRVGQFSCEESWPVMVNSVVRR